MREDDGLQQGVAREAVRTVDAGARDLPCREQPRQRRATVEIRRYPAHDVVRGGPDRNEIPREIEAGAAAGIRNEREARVHVRPIESSKREKHRLAGAPFFTRDDPRHSIA